MAAIIKDFDAKHQEALQKDRAKLKAQHAALKASREGARRQEERQRKQEQQQHRNDAKLARQEAAKTSSRNNPAVVAPPAPAAAPSLGTVHGAQIVSAGELVCSPPTAEKVTTKNTQPSTSKLKVATAPSPASVLPSACTVVLPGVGEGVQPSGVEPRRHSTKTSIVGSTAAPTAGGKQQRRTKEKWQKDILDRSFDLSGATPTGEALEKVCAESHCSADDVRSWFSR